MALLPIGPQYDPQLLLNSQPVIITVIDPLTHKVIFQNQTSQNKFGDISNLTCHEKIAGYATPCAFCKMPEAVESGKPTASEVPLPNDEYLLVQWAQVQTSNGQTHVVETITDITAIKRQQSEAEGLVKKLSNTNRDLMQANQLLRDQSIRDSLTGLFNHSHFQETLVQLCALALRAMRPLSLLFIDLDNFKQINDAYGHTMGDQVLRELGWLLDDLTQRVEHVRHALVLSNDGLVTGASVDLRREDAEHLAAVSSGLTMGCAPTRPWVL